MLQRLFTLVELLVVIAIISILASLLLPTLQTAIQSAQGANCMNNIKQHAIGAMLYADDNNGLCPQYSGYKRLGDWAFVTAPYIGFNWRSAGETALFNNTWVHSVGGKWQPRAQVYSCPSFSPGAMRFSGNVSPSAKQDYLSGNYGINFHISWYQPSAQVYNINLHKVSIPSERLLIADLQKWETPGENMSIISKTELAWRHLRNSQANYNYNGFSSSTPIVNAGTNISFVDGHVENRQAEDTPNRSMGEYFWGWNLYN